jgi:uncharacterized damage-inducible protein DinB
MNKSDIEFLYRFNAWANDLTLDVAQKVSSDQLNEKRGSSFSSLRDTLEHIFAAEWIWLERWKGISPPTLPTHFELSTVPLLRAQWDVVERQRQELIAGLTDESLGRVIQYTNTKGEQWAYPLGLMMQHLVNHSSYHRGQVTTMLRQMGAEAVSTDLLIYVDTRTGS